MCIEGDEFKECMKWPAMSLEEIMTRHEFLLKTGRYTTPDPKHPQKKMVSSGSWKGTMSNRNQFGHTGKVNEVTTEISNATSIGL